MGLASEQVVDIVQMMVSTYHWSRGSPLVEDRHQHVLIGMPALSYRCIDREVERLLGRRPTREELLPALQVPILVAMPKGLVADSKGAKEIVSRTRVWMQKKLARHVVKHLRRNALAR